MTPQERRDIIDGLTRCANLEGKKCEGCPWEDTVTGECFNRLADSTLQLIQEMQPKTAHWVRDKDGMDWNLPAWRCSECHVRNNNLSATIRDESQVFHHSGAKFCPNCGRKMVKST